MKLLTEERVTRQRAELREWYRQAMRRRITELTALRRRIEDGDPEACDGARGVAQALRGSGATFGFLELSPVAGLVEHSNNDDVLRRVEGLIGELQLIADGEEAATEGTPHVVHAGWLFRAAGLGEDFDAGADRYSDMKSVWAAAQRQAGLGADELADRVSERLGISVGDVGDPSRAALRLVPEALVTGGRIVPLAEDAFTITVATAEPTSLPTEIELQRLTGRRPVFVITSPDRIEAALADLFGTASAPAPAPVRPTIEAAEDPADRERSVLVVDDEPSARLLARRVLEKKGFEVLEAGDGIEALQMMDDSPGVGLVVADLNMPNMDGLELMWEVRDRPAWAAMPVIVVTGEVDQVVETQLMEEGADDYIRKPVDPRLLVARVEATIRRRRD